MNLFLAEAQRRRVIIIFSLRSMRLCVSARKFLQFIVIIFLFLIVSCTRGSGEKAGTTTVPETWQGAKPAAILQTGEYPLWFQLTDDGPVYIESVEYAVQTSSFIPWPYALHIRFLHEREDGLVMVINRGGFLKLAPNDDGRDASPHNDTAEDDRLVMYHFSGGEFWRQYTTGGFVFYEDKPAALLYLDNRIMETGLSPPRPAIWSFSMESNIPFPIEIPVFRFFPEEDGWEADTLRFGNDGLIYYRTARRSGSSPAVKMFRTTDLTKQGEEISIEIFYNSAPRRPEIFPPSLPELPENFFYTETGEIGSSVFAAWEEQMEFSIAAAGFVVIKKDLTRSSLCQKSKARIRKTQKQQYNKRGG